MLTSIDQRPVCVGFIIGSRETRHPLEEIESVEKVKKKKETVYRIFECAVACNIWPLLDIRVSFLNQSGNS